MNSIDALEKRYRKHDHTLTSEQVKAVLSHWKAQLLEQPRTILTTEQVRSIDIKLKTLPIDTGQGLCDNPSHGNNR